MSDKDTTNIIIGKNAPKGMGKFMSDIAKGRNSNITDFRDDVPNITAARNIQEKLKAEEIVDRNTFEVGKRYGFDSVAGYCEATAFELKEDSISFIDVVFNDGDDIKGAKQSFLYTQIKDVSSTDSKQMFNSTEDAKSLLEFIGVTDDLVEKLVELQEKAKKLNMCVSAETYPEKTGQWVLSIIDEEFGFYYGKTLDDIEFLINKIELIAKFARATKEDTPANLSIPF